MNIALMSHDNKKDLMVQFCTAYAGILSQHQIFATNTTGHMVAFEREYIDGKYNCKLVLLPLSKVANYEKKVPVEWINEEGNGLKQEFIDYVLPLIQGEPEIPKVDSLPRYARLKKVLAK